MHVFLFFSLGYGSLPRLQLAFSGQHIRQLFLRLFERVALFESLHVLADLLLAINQQWKGNAASKISQRREARTAQRTTCN